MKRIVISILFAISILLMYSCGSEEKKPFGAENIDYNQVEKLNKEGPIIESAHAENAPPISDIIATSEIGPARIDYSDKVVEPTADKEEEPDYGGIPIVTRERKS